jgi:hypothetical protein
MESEEHANIFHYIPSEQLIGELNNDLICFICYGVSFKPIYLKCCEHLICLDCVKQYLRLYNKCPLCKSGIKFDRPSRIIMRLFERLVLKCHKCEVAVEYNNYFPHMVSCTESNYRYCRTCETLYQEEHNCNLIKYGGHSYNQVEAKFFQFLGKKRLIKNNREDSVYEPVLHKHKLIFTNIRWDTAYLRVGWECDYCNALFDKNKGSYFCDDCKIDVCIDCYNKYDKNREKFVHRHELTTLSKYDWKCKDCKKYYEYRISISCEGCDIDTCLNCYIKN